MGPVMTLDPVATELTTAATDLLLTLVASLSVLWLWRQRAADRWRRRLWLVLLSALALGSGLAAVAHGLVIPGGGETALWGAIYLALGIMISGFVVAAFYEFRGVRAARRSLQAMAVLLALFLLAVGLMGGDFAPFILFEALAMLTALALYARLGWIEGRREARWMVAGILVTLVAAALQAMRWGAFVWIWPFDHNGAFHLLQLLGLACMLIALRGWMVRG